MIKLGAGNVTLYLGDKKVKAAWLGTEKVYPNSSLVLSASSLSFAAAGQEQQLAITVDEGQAWTIAALPAGFSVSSSSGTGPATVTVTADNNTSTTARTGDLTVNSEELSATCSLSQTAGAKVYGAWQNVRLETEGNITSFAAGGGTAKIHMVVERTWTWNGVAGSGGSETNWSQPADVTVSDTIASVSADVLTVGSLGTTFKAATQILIGAGTASDTVSTNRKTLAITQAANYVTAARALKTRTLTYPQIGAGGGTSNVQWDAYPTDADIDKLWGFTWASGANGTWSQAKLGGSNAQTGMSYKWAGASGNFTALNTSTGAVTASSKGTTVNGVTSSPTITATQTCKFTNNAAYGGSSVSWDTTATGTCSQAANAVTGYGTPTGRTLSVADIPASGGSVSSGTLGGTITQSRTFTSGASDTLTNPTVSASSYSAAVSGANLGTTVTSRTAKGTLTHYYTCNGKQGSCSATVYQAANTWYDHDIVLSANSTSIGAAGGSVTLTATIYRMYASGTRAVGGSGYGTLSGSATGFTVSGWTVTAAGRGTTVGAARSISVVCKYNGLTSNSVTVTQAANAAKAGSTYILVNGSQATSKSLSFGNAASTQYLRLRQKQNYSYTSGATEVVDTSKKPSFASSSGYFTVKDATDYGGNPTVPEYMFGITVTANSSSSSRSATVTFTFPNGDKVTASCTQSAGGGTTTKPQYLKIMADSVTAGNSSVPSLTVAWGTTAGSYSNSETLTASNITTTGKTVSLGNMASGRTIYFKFTGQVTPVKMASIEFTGSGLTLSGDTSYLGASAVEFYGQMSVDATSKTANLNITTVQ